MVLAAPSSEDEKKSVNSMSTAATWLLSSAATSNSTRSYIPCVSPREIRKIRILGSYPDTDTTREDVEVALPRRIRGVSNFNYRVGAVE